MLAIMPVQDLFGSGIIDQAKEVFAQIERQPLESQIEIINALRLELHRISPFREEPVDCVLWVKSDSVEANDYNPNSVAPPEMKLLERSIEADGSAPTASARPPHRFVIV